MKKILIFNTNLAIGGAEKVLLNFTKELSKKYKITILLFFYEGELINEIPNNVDVRYIFKSPSKLKRRIIYKVIKFIPGKLLYNMFRIDRNYDLEIAFLEGIPVKILSGSRQKKIAWIHTNLNEYHRTANVFTTINNESKSLKKYQNIIAVSDEVKSGLINKFKKIDNDQITVVENFVDIDEIVNKSNEYLKDNIITNNNITFCSVGRLVKENGYDRLIRIHKKLLDEGFNHNIIIVGGGYLKEELKEKINEYNIEKSFKLIGADMNPYRYIKYSDVYINCSYVEGYPVSLIEALALKKAIIAVDTAGVKKILNNGEYGKIINNTDLEIYYEMKNIISNPQYLDILNKNACLGYDSIDNSKIVEKIMNIIDKL